MNCDCQQQKLANLPVSATDQYQIMREDHDLGIDAFVAEAMRLSPNVTPTQALNLLQAYLEPMLKSGDTNRPVGGPGWFLCFRDLLQASLGQYLWLFYPTHWQNQLQADNQRQPPRVSYF